MAFLKQVLKNLVAKVYISSYFDSFSESIEPLNRSLVKLTRSKSKLVNNNLANFDSNNIIGNPQLS